MTTEGKTCKRHFKIHKLQCHAGMIANILKLLKNENYNEKQ